MCFAMTVQFYMKKKEIRCVQGKIIIKFLNNKVCDVINYNLGYRSEHDVSQQQDIKYIDVAPLYLWASAFSLG